LISKNMNQTIDINQWNINTLTNGEALSIPLPITTVLDKVVASVRGIEDGLCSSSRRHKVARVKRWGKSLPVF